MTIGRIMCLVAGALMLAPAAVAQGPAVRVQSAAEALAQDAREYAARYGVSVEEALPRLRAQEESVAATDRLREIYRERLAGIYVEHRPEYRIVVALTGSEPVADTAVRAGGMDVAVVFRTGAAATGEEVLEAIRRHQLKIMRAVRGSSGMGVDPRRGELVLLVKAAEAEFYGRETIRAEIEEMTGVPVQVRVLDTMDANFGIEGGARVEGIDPANSRRYACTTGYVVVNGSRTGIVTAAHCPDALTYFDPDGGGVIPLEFIGQWGARYQDVQVHVSDRVQQPLFYADSRKSSVRPLTSWRNRSSTRAGEFVCRRGETSGYSCSEVELVDYAPPGALCGGPCDPTWVTVTGPSCRSGDSGAPVFLGTTAFGIVKGGNYDRSGRCSFYYYMSTDYLPEGWSLLYQGAPPLHQTADDRPEEKRREIGG